jgi:hypothetical protein
MRRRPERRIELPRSSENQKRDLSATLPTTEERGALAARAEYEGYGKHKRNPSLWGLAPFHGHAPDRTFCEDAEFLFEHRGRVPQLLQRGIEAGLFGDLISQGDPTMLWTIDDNGWIYELRLTTPSQALYHGYPLRLANAFGRRVIARYGDWLDTLTPARLVGEPELRTALRESQKLYN